MLNSVEIMPEKKTGIIEIIDGTGSSVFKGDIAIQDDRIKAVGRVGDPEAREVIDPGGLCHEKYDGAPVRPSGRRMADVERAAVHPLQTEGTYGILVDFLIPKISRPAPPMTTPSSLPPVWTGC